MRQHRAPVPPPFRVHRIQRRRRGEKERLEVYGDTEYECHLEDLRRELICRARRRDTSVDALRALLIRAGQAEQGVEDALPREAAAPCGSAFRAATDAFARAFLARWNHGECPTGEWAERARAALGEGARALERAGNAPAVSLTLKVPEGFAYYALYPEQYARAARDWAAGRERGPVVVAGVRSIGTTLSALVAATLEADGWDAHRLTTRPSGDPFRREARLPATRVPVAAWGIVVDEGPGLSGSSMASVALSLRGAGLRAERIAFLTGHGSGPGAMTSDAIREVWESTNVYPAAAAPPRWGGLDLMDFLIDATQAAAGHAEVSDVHDLGGGAWRELLYPRGRCRPAVATSFERAKYRLTLSDGTAVLWKFAGLADRPDGSGPAFEAEAATLCRRARQGWTVPPMAATQGFVAIPWVEGRPLRRADGTRDVAQQIGRYIADAAGPPLSEPQVQASLDRLCRMLSANLTEAIGKSAAERALERAGRVRAAAMPAASAGDGRLAPHEWRCHAGRLLKLDATPHDVTHTIVGLQPAAWDIAAALVEWGFRGPRAQALEGGYEMAGGAPIAREVIAFYRLAYAAFRMGEAALHAAMARSDSEERTRNARAEERYRRAALRALEAASG